VINKLIKSFGNKFSRDIIFADICGCLVGHKIFILEKSSIASQEILWMKKD